MLLSQVFIICFTSFSLCLCFRKKTFLMRTCCFSNSCLQPLLIFKYIYLICWLMKKKQIKSIPTCLKVETEPKAFLHSYSFLKKKFFFVFDETTNHFLFILCPTLWNLILLDIKIITILPLSSITVMSPYKQLMA